MFHDFVARPVSVGIDETAIITAYCTVLYIHSEKTAATGTVLYIYSKDTAATGRVLYIYSKKHC